jgi:hypothetical protein
MIYGLYSPQMQSGKSTIAEYLESRGFLRVKFASTLKNMIRVMLTDLGYQDSYDFIEGCRKEEMLPELGVSTRYLMQTLGTEWGRDIVRESLWTDIVINKINNTAQNVVVDDLRFPNEFKALRDIGAVLIKVVRPVDIPSANHPSEGSLNDLDFDITLYNTGTVEDLVDWADKCLTV